MSKKLFFTMLVLVFISAFILCGCDVKDPSVTDPAPVDLSWHTIESPTPADVYNKLLSGFMNVATDFSVKSLTSSPVLGADAKLKISMGDLVLWATLKGNYNNNNKANAMLSLEISTVEDSYDDIVLALYLYNEMMYLTIGDTKLKFDMKLSKWENFFPFDMALDNSKSINNAASFMYMVLEIKDNIIAGKTRLNGLVEEYNYAFSLDLAGSLTKVQTYITNSSSATDTDMINKINKIFANVLGLSIEDIIAGNVPEAQLDIDFSTANTKISDLNFSVNIDQSGEYANTLFAGEDINLQAELMKFETTKAPVTIDFVNSTAKQSEFVDYLNGDYTFKFSLDINKITNLETKATKDYTLIMSAKVFQEISADNYVLLEYYDKATSTLEKALYVYNNQMYTFDTIDSQFVCTTKMAIDLSNTASKVYDNTLTATPTSSFSAFNTISYLLGAMRIETNDFLFNITDKLFSEVWFNYSQLLTYVDSLMVENIYENTNLNNFEKFISDYDAIAIFNFDNDFLTVIDDDTDANLINAKARMNSCTPLVIFTPVTTG